MGGAQFLEKSLCKVISLQLIKINEKKSLGKFSRMAGVLGGGRLRIICKEQWEAVF